MAFTGSYIAPVEFRCTGTPAAGTTVWIARGPAQLSAFVRRVRLTLGFDGTAAAATLRLGLYTGTGAASATGGTAITPGKKSEGYPTSTMQDVRQDVAAGALTTAGITFAADPLHVFGLPISVTGHNVFVDVRFGLRNDLDDARKLGANDHIALRVQTVAGVIGWSATGDVEWDEA